MTPPPALLYTLVALLPFLTACSISTADEYARLAALSRQQSENERARSQACAEAKDYECALYWLARSQQDDAQAWQYTQARVQVYRDFTAALAGSGRSQPQSGFSSFNQMQQQNEILQMQNDLHRLKVQQSGILR